MPDLTPTAERVEALVERRKLAGRRYHMAALERDYPNLADAAAEVVAANAALSQPNTVSSR